MSPIPPTTAWAADDLAPWRSMRCLNCTGIAPEHSLLNQWQARSERGELGMSIEIKQIRAARELLNWRQAQLAEAARIRLSTVKNFESERRPLTEAHLLAIWRAFEKAGIVFDRDRKCLGVRVKHRRGRSHGRPFGARQSRAARKLLDWTQSCLSKAASIPFGTVRSFEGEQRPTTEASLSAIVRAFEEAGVAFQSDGKSVAVKVKIRPA
jgi:DNA-binding transcriptional regulator YiaG